MYLATSAPAMAVPWMWTRKPRSVACCCSSRAPEDEPNNEIDKVLESEESKALLRDLAAASQRVERLRNELKQNADEEEKQSEQEVLAALTELKAAQLQLVDARAKQSANVDAGVERLESGKAALTSALAGTCATLPFASSSSSYQIAVVLVSCAVYGVTYRYAVRRDLNNFQLKTGAAAGFALVRGLAQLPQLPPDLLVATEILGQNVVIFLAATLAIDFCFKKGLIQPFPSLNK